MSLKRVEGYSALRKDTINGGVVNIDKTSFDSYKLTKMRAVQKQKEIAATQENVTVLQEQINTITSDLTEIKNLLVNLLDKDK